MAEAAGGHILHNLLLFGRLLRRLGLDVHVGRMLDAVAVIDDIGLAKKGDFRATLRTLLVHRKDDLALFDEAFDVFWRQPKDPQTTMDLRSMGEQRTVSAAAGGACHHPARRRTARTRDRTSPTRISTG